MFEQIHKFWSEITWALGLIGGLAGLIISMQRKIDAIQSDLHSIKGRLTKLDGISDG